MWSFFAKHRSLCLLYPLFPIVYYRANVGSSVLSSLLIELLHCRDGSLSSLSSKFNMADISSMIDFICTFE